MGHVKPNFDTSMTDSANGETNMFEISANHSRGSRKSRPQQSLWYRGTMNQMNHRIPLIFKVVGLLVLVLLTASALIGCWITRTEDTCWKHEATDAFQKYGSLKTRFEILRSTDTDQASGSNPVEGIEKDPNGCSFGSNGRTVLRFYFDERNKLTTIQVFRDYIASDYKMELIEERKY